MPEEIVQAAPEAGDTPLPSQSGDPFCRHFSSPIGQIFRCSGPNVPRLAADGRLVKKHLAARAVPAVLAHSAGAGQRETDK
ncbi:hypothetical protein INR49_026236 [Caranx melampygus]|nr:hypothetical protein INR49_026236 [Caranx melampygus]